MRGRRRRTGSRLLQRSHVRQELRREWPCRIRRRGAAPGRARFPARRVGGQRVRRDGSRCRLQHPAGRTKQREEMLHCMLNVAALRLIRGRASGKERGPMVTTLFVIVGAWLLAMIGSVAFVPASIARSWAGRRRARADDRSDCELGLLMSRAPASAGQQYTHIAGAQYQAANQQHGHQRSRQTSGKTITGSDPRADASHSHRTSALGKCRRLNGGVAMLHVVPLDSVLNWREHRRCVSQSAWEPEPCPRLPRPTLTEQHST